MKYLKRDFLKTDQYKTLRILSIKLLNSSDMSAVKIHITVATNEEQAITSLDLKQMRDCNV